MHNNYYFLKQLSKSLETKLAGTVISECFSQNKDELIIRFETATVPFFIRASLTPGFSCLTFPDDFHRARKNSIDLFGNMIGRRIINMTQFNNERSFALNLSDHFALVFKMHGNRSNVLLFEGARVTNRFNNSIEADKLVSLESLHRSIDFSHSAFTANINNLKHHYVTFGKTIWRYLDQLNFNTQSPDEKWTTIQQVIAQLEHPPYFLILELNGVRVLSLVNFGNELHRFDSAIDAVNEFFHSFIQSQAFTREKERLLSDLRSTFRSNQQYLEKIESKLKEIETDTSYKTWADLIMANLHAIRPGSEKVYLPDFNTNHSIEIKLKKDISPQKNAEVFYKKSKNQHIEIHHLKNTIDQKREETVLLQEQIKKLEASENLKQLRSNIPSVQTSQKERKKESVPYVEFDYKGFKIWVGKNAQSNDRLTLKHGYKEDLWLHAKDVPGSHVLIKHQAGKPFPKDVIERAGQLAAYYSKRKNESLCPITVTPRKFVRKRKGDPAGTVVVEREEVILVEPVKW